MPADYLHIDWPEAEADARELVRLALAEDLASGHDMTTEAVVPADREGRARVVARESGIVCGLPIGQLVRSEAGAEFDWLPAIADGDRFEAGACLATIAGPARELLTCERTLLNFIGRLSGVATQARRYVDAAGNTDAEIYDTRKTTPGWRRLEKYAVACGGGRNHRTGLYDAVLIKDNHLALAADQGLAPGDAVDRARAAAGSDVVIEIEVDTLAQLRAVLPRSPDVVLLDNMTAADLREAVALRNRLADKVVLEASGGVTLETIGGVAATGVDRISVGALTHAARSLDVGLDWGP